VKEIKKELNRIDRVHGVKIIEKDFDTSNLKEIMF
jgi:hypothetical protein